MNNIASKLAIASFIASLMLVIPVVSGIAAIILGILALTNTSSQEKDFKNKSFAFVGIGFGSLQLLICLLILGLVIMANQQNARKDRIERLREESRLRPGIEPHNRITNQSVKKGGFFENHQKGFELMNTNKKDEAIDYFQAAVDVSKKELASSYYGIGSVLMDQKKYPSALEYFDQAINYNPDHYDAYQNKAVTLRRMGKYPESIEACKKTISLFPDSGKSHCSLGWAYEFNGNFVLACESHIKAIELAPNWGFPKSRLRKSLSKIDDSAKYQKIIDKLERIDPNLAEKILNNQ